MRLTSARLLREAIRSTMLLLEYESIVDKKERAKVELASAHTALDALKAKIQAAKDTKQKTGNLERSLPRLMHALAKAQTEYDQYDIEKIAYEPGKKKTSVPETVAKEFNTLYVDVTTLRPLKWYAWPSVVANVKFGDIEEKSGEEIAGTGPGEERLAKLFGGRIMGGSTSYDVISPDGSKWEVKALNSPSDTIRPGTEGKAAYARARKKLESIIRQMKNFVTISTKLRLELSFEGDSQNLAIVNYVKGFVDDNFEMIVSKGEIGDDRMEALEKAIFALSRIKSQRGAGKVDPAALTITVGDHTVKVDQQTYIDVIKRLESFDKSVVESISTLDVALASLKDPVFDNPDTFISKFKGMVSVENVFSQVAGVIIVNKKLGFNIVPRRYFNVFHFVKVTQLTPRFKFTAFDSPQLTLQIKAQKVKERTSNEPPPVSTDSPKPTPSEPAYEPNVSEPVEKKPEAI